MAHTPSRARTRTRHVRREWKGSRVAAVARSHRTLASRRRRPARQACDAVRALGPARYVRGACVLRELAFVHGSSDNLSAVVVDMLGALPVPPPPSPSVREAHATVHDYATLEKLKRAN